MEAEKKPVSNKEVAKKAILVGCNNYPNPKENLSGCHNDVYNMHNTLIKRFRFDPKRIVVMVDKPGSKQMPTAANIKKQLKKMIEDADEGDRLFFYFSGHGMPICHNGEIKQAIVPSDDNLITCMDFRYYVNRLPKKATFTIMADSCCSGGLIDQEPVQVGQPYIVQPPKDQSCVGENKPKMIPYESYMANLSARTGLNDPDIGAHLFQLFGSEASIMFRLPPDQHPKPLKIDQGILLSGSEPSEDTIDDPADKNGPAGGAFTKTVVAILKGHPAPITNKKLVNKARGILGNRKKYPQHPCLYCSSKNADAVFLRKASHGLAEIGESSEDRVLED
ncbi:hypothetical protein ABFX02_11G020400 [Erythranthe guttata]